jgi:fibronectin-binding autotransporter adhesin
LHVRGDGNAAELVQHRHGLVLGSDRAVGDDWHIGGALGYSDADIDIDDRQSEADIRSYSGALFGGRSFQAHSGALALLGGAIHTRHNIDTRRHTRVADAPQRLTAGYGGHTTELFIELGYVIALSPRSSLAPFVGLGWSEVRTSGFTEAGGSAALTGQRTHDTQSSSALGLRGQTEVVLGQTRGLLKATLGWQHAFGERGASRTLAFAGGQAFTVASVPLARDAAIVELGADLQITPSTTLGLGYSGQFASGNREHRGVLSLQWHF